MSIYADERDMNAGEVVTETHDGHEFTITALDETGIHSGRTRYRVSCLTCRILVHSGSTSANAQIRFHIRSQTDPT